MCILCVIQRCWRRVATMLPWLVIPLIGLWALSQLLPPPFRFEITSPRIACVSVLLVTLFWYEVLMPWLSVWRVRRNAMLRERKRCEAIELQKLRKTATRRCRNCLTPYRDQNPGAGKFMCSYCGHISKRPVLDLPVPPGMGASGILKELVGKGRKILNGKAWSDNGWMCGQDWLENGNWIGGTLSGKSSYWKNNNVFFGDSDHCVTNKSYSRIFLVAFKAIISAIFSIMWLWRKIFRVSSSEDDVTDAERREILDKQGENGANGQVSRVEKARRKAEEKRLARLEKELLEEEEKKQREEVARLVEEQRRLRDEILETEKPRGKISPRGKEIDTKKEGEKKRQERKKERDRLSSKSNSDAEEFEKRERNKKSESDRREQHGSSPESKKAYSTEVGHVFKGASASSQNKGNAGTRYFDRMKGTLLSSSRAFTGGGLFGKSSNTTSDPREHRPNIFVDHAQTSTYRKDMVQPDSVHGRSNVKGDEKSVSRHTPIEPQPCTAPKRSWQQLFTRSTAASPPSDSNVIGRPNGKCQAEVQSPPFSSQHASTQSYDKPLNFGLPSPIAPPSFALGSTSSSSSLPLSSESMFPRIGDMSVKILPEESEIFEDPCYIPDPTFRVGPVYEPIGNSQLDVGFMTDSGLRTPFAVKTVSGPSEVTKPSPIESPLSRSRVSEERHTSSFLFPNTPEAQDNSNSVMETGVWQMWSSCPLGQDSLGLGGGSVSWLLPPEIRKEDNINPVSHKTMASLFKKDEKVISGTHSPQHVVLANCQNIGKFNTFVPAPVGGPLFPEIPFGSTSIYNNQILLKQDEAAWRSLSDGNSTVSPYNHQSEMSTANSWAKKEWTVQGSRDGVGNSPISRPPHIGGLFTPPDVQSLWSYDLKPKEK